MTRSKEWEKNLVGEKERWEVEKERPGMEKEGWGGYGNKVGGGKTGFGSCKERRSESGGRSQWQTGTMQYIRINHLGWFIQPIFW